MSFPSISKVIFPDVKGIDPEMHLSKVDFPEPFPPVIANESP
jgi:hypothetical protein